MKKPSHAVLGALRAFLKNPLVVILLKYGLGIGVLAWLIVSHWHIERDGKDEGLAAALNNPDRPFQTGFFLLSALLCLAALLITFVRWYLLVRAQDLPFSASSAVRIGFIGYFMNTFLPGSVGGDIVKAAFLAREQRRRTVAVATVLADRLIGFCGLFLVTALMGGYFWVSGQLPEIGQTASATTVLETIIWGMAVLSAASLLVWLAMGVLPARWIEGIGAWLSRCPKIGGNLRELWTAVWMYRRKTKNVALCLALSMVSHVGFFLSFYYSALTLNPASEAPSLRAHMLIVPVGTTIQAGFPAPGGMGGGEFGFGLLYQAVGYPQANGVWTSLIQRSITWILGFLGYLVYLRMRRGLSASALPGTHPESTTQAPEAAGPALVTREASAP